MSTISYKENLISFPRLFVAITIAILCILLDTIGMFDEIKSIATTINSNIGDDIKYKFGAIDYYFYRVEERRDLTFKIESLEKEVINLRSENVVLSNKLEEISILKDQNTFSADQNLLSGRIISNIPDEFGHVLVNKGEKQKVKIGDGVVFRNYAVGEVIEVYGDTSKVELTISPKSEIPASSEKNNALGVVKGDISDGLLMREIPVNSIISEGELILTTGIDSTLPKGYILGQVKEVEAASSQSTKTAKIDILIDLKRLSEVFIIISEK